MKTLLLLCLILISPFLSFSQTGPDHVVYFDVDSYRISGKEKERFQACIEKIDWDNRVNQIRLYGHTDADADNAYNQRLSENRVQSTKQLFATNPKFQSVTAEFFGEEKPLNNNATSSEKSLNRRVEIWIDWVPDYVEEEGDIRDLYKQLEQEKQSICIHPRGDTTIRLEQGTIIYFPANAFGERTGKCIEIKAKEFYKMSDMLLENLSTTSNGKLLETEGMIYLEALYKGESIELAPGKKVTILMPTDSLRTDVGIFYGERDEHSDVMNWVMNNGTSIQGLKCVDALNCMDYTRELDISINPCERCKFFCRLARMDEPFKGMVNASTRSDNKDFRKCQRNLRRLRRQGITAPPAPTVPPPAQGDPIEDNAMRCSELDSLYEVYGVSDRMALLEAMNKDLLDEYGVKSLSELRDTLNKIKLKQMEEDFKNDKASKESIDYYVFNSSRLGWINIDAFSKLDGKKITMFTELTARKSTDCKLIFEKVKGIMPGKILNEKFAFIDVPQGQPVWIVGLKYANGQAYISMVKSTVKEEAPKFKFEAVSLSELREKMKMIDR